MLGTNSSEQSASWKSNSSSPRQKIPLILWNPTIHYRVHKNQTFAPNLSRKKNAVQALPPPRPHPISLTL
jgi:hypothetical protein